MEANGLKRSKDLFVLNGEAEAQLLLAKLLTTKSQTQTVVYQLESTLAQQEFVEQLDTKRILAKDQEDATRITLDALGRPINNFEVEARALAEQRWLQARDDHRLIRLNLELARKNLADLSGGSWKALCVQKGSLDKTYREDLNALRDRVDQVKARYQALQQDDSIKAAIQSQASGKEMIRLGPSKQFQNIEQKLLQAEQEFKARQN